MTKKKEDKLSPEELQQMVEEEKREREQEFTRRFQELMNELRCEVNPRTVIVGNIVQQFLDVRAL